MAILISRLAGARRTLLAAAVCAAMSSLGAADERQAASGNVWTVANCDDDGSPGTLRAAIEGASDGDTIDLRDLTCSLIKLQSGTLLSPVSSLTILGPGSGALTIDGNDNMRVMQGSDLAIEGLTIANGQTATPTGGACILANHNLSLTDVAINHCSELSAANALGGALFIGGDLTMHASSITASGAAGATSAVGGGALVGGFATLYDSLISGNNVQAGENAYGGGLSANQGIALHSSTMEGNSAQASTGSAYGGGLHSFGGYISVLDGSSISGNIARSEQSFAYGGGINAGILGSGGSITTKTSTVTGNSASSNCTICLVSGGGVHAFDSIDAAYSTFSYNEASCDDPASQCSTGGGGIAALGQSATSFLTVRNTTISGNNVIGGSGAGAFSAGGGIMAASGLRLIARNSTIAFNDAGTLGGGVVATTSSGLPSVLVSTIVALNHNDGGAGDIGAGPFANELVLEGSNSLVTAADSGVTLPADTKTEEPLLLPLSTDNGGVTATHALAIGSPAIDAGLNPDGFVSDQRGFPHRRVVGMNADIGAYEFDADTIFIDSFDP